MRVLITSAASPWPRELAALLSGSHDVRLTDQTEVSSDLEFVRSDLGHEAPTNDLVRGMDAIVHPGDVDPAASVSDQLDFQMRCSYNLLWAAAEEGVSRFVYLSSLHLMDKYDEGLAVTERWRPVPTVDVPVLCYHLGEYVCREFAREGKADVVVLRLGDITANGSPAQSSSALYVDDAVQAVDRALTADLSGWNIFHIQSAVPNARFPTGQPWRKANGDPPVSLGYTPRPRGGGGK